MLHTKQISAIALTVLVLLNPLAYAEGDAQTTATKASHTMTIRVNGLVCDFCAIAIEKVFLRESGVRAVDVDLNLGTIVVELDPKQCLSLDRIDTLTTDAGYTLTSIEEGECS